MERRGAEGPISIWAKPAGIPVFPPHADPAGDCALRRLLDAEPARGALPWPDGFAGGIAHRLDTSTSGALLIADDPVALGLLRERFARGGLVKRYLFLTAKAVPWSQHQIDRPIAHDPRHKRRVIVQRGENTPHRGRWLPAATRFVHLGPLGDGLHLWQATMSTGVMHQIRAHAAALGLALVGDRLYGGGENPLAVDPQAPFFLHHHGVVGLPTCPLPATWPGPARRQAAELDG